MDNELNAVVDEIVSPETMESAETPEVAEPAQEESVEKSEVAEPTISKKDADAAFAQMRRENEQLRREKAELNDTLGLFFDGDDKIAAAKAHYYGKDVETVKAEMAEAQEVATLKARVQELESEKQDYIVQSRIESDLATLQKLDPNIKTVQDMEKMQEYLRLIAAKVPCEIAYEAQKAYDARHEVSAPKAIGALNNEAPEKDFYTPDEVRAMSESEIHKNFDKIMASQAKWK